MASQRVTAADVGDEGYVVSSTTIIKVAAYCIKNVDMDTSI